MLTSSLLTGLKLEMEELSKIWLRHKVYSFNELVQYKCLTVMLYDIMYYVQAPQLKRTDEPFMEVSIYVFTKQFNCTAFLLIFQI